jgi:hypothetical protein
MTTTREPVHFRAARQEAAVSTVSFRIEGLNASGEWVMLDRMLPAEGDHAARRDDVIKHLRFHGIDRYSKVRLVKVITTTEVVGQEITV